MGVLFGVFLSVLLFISYFATGLSRLAVKTKTKEYPKGHKNQEYYKKDCSRQFTRTCTTKTGQNEEA